MTAVAPTSSRHSRLSKFLFRGATQRETDRRDMILRALKCEYAQGLNIYPKLDELKLNKKAHNAP
jgi:hypothetical protein